MRERRKARVFDTLVLASRPARRGEVGVRIGFEYICESRRAALKFAAEYRAGRHHCRGQWRCSDCPEDLNAVK